MKKTAISILFYIYVYSSFAQEIKISGMIISGRDQKPIPYASIIDISTSKTGTTSNLYGKFKLTLPSESENNRIYFSSLGHIDTSIYVKDIIKMAKPVILKEKIIMLNEVVVTPELTKKAYFGKPFAELNDSPIWGGKPGFFIGAFFDIKNNKKGIIKSISICIGEKGFSQAPFSLRLLIPKSKEKPNRIKPLSEYYDAIPEPLSFSAKKSGWFEIDLSKFNISLPAQGLYILIIPLDCGDKYKWAEIPEDERYWNYGISIASYKYDQKGVFVAYFVKNGIGHIKRNQVLKTPIAIAVTYSTL